MSDDLLVAQGDYVETVWAKALGEDLFQIDNIPFGLRNLSLGDIVKGHREENVIQLDGLHQKSGARTLQVSVEAGTQSPTGQKIVEQLRKMDLPFEAYERVVPGSPAEKQREEALSKTWAEAFAKGSKPTE